jgi:ATP-binding cassette, subfamily B, bacterial
MSAEAAEVCRELGLTDLIGRMPAGLNQYVGDTGWRLSQGERSRIFLARALLQKAEIVVLDESLAALDPENLRQCLECILRRAPTLILIAHL